MRALSPSMTAHLAGETTSLATCWRLIRRDGVMLGFTTHDRDLVIDGQLYRSNMSFLPSAVSAGDQLSVDNLEVSGALSSAAISEGDLMAGRYDFARIDIFMVNWATPDDGGVFLRTGYLGEIRLEDGKFIAELRGLKQALQQEIGAVYSPECRADLGDRQCRVALRGITLMGRVGNALGAARFDSPALTQADNWFRYGRLRWHSGANAGLDFLIKDYAGGALTLRAAPPQPIAPGDLFEAAAGCDKRFATCRDKFGNALNFRGEPFVPGVDSLIRYPGL